MGLFEFVVGEWVQYQPRLSGIINVTAGGSANQIPVFTSNWIIAKWMWSSLPMTSDGSMVFIRFVSFLQQYNWRQRYNLNSV
jgi:hypothetical protein